MKKLFFLLLSLVLCFVSCSNEEDQLQDEYYVQYKSHNSHFGIPTDFSYIDADNSTKTADKEVAIGPVRKGFVAKMSFKSVSSGTTLTISVSKNSSPWLVKATEKNVNSITYTIDF